MKSGKWHRHVIRVRYQETDQMGVVYHANYLNWFEIGRTEMIRALGMPYRRLEASGLLLPVVEAGVHFKRPARYDDLVAIYTSIRTFSNVQLQFSSEIRKLAEEPEAESDAERSGDRLVDAPEGELLVSGFTRHVWLNRQWKPVRIDREAPELYRLIAETARCGE